MNDATPESAAALAEEPRELHHLTAEEMPAILRISEMLRRFVDLVGRFGSWFAVPLILMVWPV